MEKCRLLMHHDMKGIPQTWSFSISYLEFWIRAEGKFTQPGVELQISKMSVHLNRCHTLKFINEFLLHVKCLLVSLVVQLKRIPDSKFLGCYVCIEWSCTLRSRVGEPFQNFDKISVFETLANWLYVLYLVTVLSAWTFLRIQALTGWS